MCSGKSCFGCVVVGTCGCDCLGVETVPVAVVVVINVLVFLDGMC